MEKLSFFEKLGVLGSNILAHPLFIVLLLVPVVLLALNKRITKKGVIAIYIGVIAIVLFVGNTTLFKLFDNMIDGLFMTLYFPNFITLFIVVVLSAVITLITFLKKRIRRVSKIINITGFAIIQTIFCLILTVVQVNNIDIYKENALYSSGDVLTLMQLLMGTFALQLVTLLIVNAIETITDRLDTQEEEGRMNSIQRKIHKLNEKLKISDPEITQGKTVITTGPIEQEEIKPLDKSLIEEEKIAPINLSDEQAAKKLTENYHVINRNRIEMPDLLEPMNGTSSAGQNRSKRKNKPKFINPPIIYVTPPQELYDQLEKANKQEELERIKKDSAAILERYRAEKEKEMKTVGPKFINNIEESINQKGLDEIPIVPDNQKYNKPQDIVKIEGEKKEKPKPPKSIYEPEIIRPETKFTDTNPKEIISKETSNNQILKPSIFDVPAAKPQTVVAEAPAPNKLKATTIYEPPAPKETPVTVEMPINNYVAPEKPVNNYAPVEPVRAADKVATAYQEPKPVASTTFSQEAIAPLPEINKGPIIKPAQEPQRPVEPVIQEEKDLIADLVIVNYDKTIQALGNIKRIYTL